MRQSASTNIATTTASLHLEPSSTNSDSTFNSNIQINSTQTNQPTPTTMLNTNNMNLNARERSNTIVIMPSTYAQQNLNTLTQTNTNMNRGASQNLPSRCLETHNMNIGRLNVHSVANPKIIPKAHSTSTSNYLNRSSRNLSIPISVPNNISQSSSSNSTQSSTLSTSTNTPTKANSNPLSSIVLSHKKNKSILSHLEQCEACSQQASALENESNVALDLSKTQSAGDLLHVLPPPLFDNDTEIKSTSSSITR